MASAKKAAPKKELPEYATHIRKLRGSSTMAVFAGSLGVTPMAVSRWESGANAPGSATYFKMARLATDDSEREWFIQQGSSDIAQLAVDIYSRGAIEDAADQSQGGASKVCKVALLKSPAAMVRAMGIRSRDIERTVELAAELFNGASALYGITIEDGSMEPLLPFGCLALVSRAKLEIEDLLKKIVVARIGERAIVGWLRKVGDTYTLQPENLAAGFEVQVLQRGGDWSVAGEVVSWIAKPPPRK